MNSGEARTVLTTCLIELTGVSPSATASVATFVRRSTSAGAIGPRYARAANWLTICRVQAVSSLGVQVSRRDDRAGFANTCSPTASAASQYCVKWLSPITASLGNVASAWPEAPSSSLTALSYCAFDRRTSAAPDAADGLTVAGALVAVGSGAPAVPASVLQAATPNERANPPSSSQPVP